MSIQESGKLEMCSYIMSGAAVASLFEAPATKILEDGLLHPTGHFHKAGDLTSFWKGDSLYHTEDER